MPSLNELLAKVESHRDEMIEALSELIRIPAIGPENGGDGEFERARFLKEVLEHSMFDDVEMYDALDERVRLRLRPNIAARRKGRTDQMVWVVVHMDTVPPGDLNSWEFPPFSPRLVDGKLYGLGSEDNGQALVAAMFAAEMLMSMNVALDKGLGMAFVSDEEAGSDKGIKFMIQEGVFRRDDIIFVPDHGVRDGSAIEVSEKTIVWLKFTVTGKQAHASLPATGLNAMKAGSEFMLFLQDFLLRKYKDQDELFDPMGSTFEPTKRLQTVGNVNTVPGEDIFYFDCRILPRYDLEQVMDDIRAVADIYQQKTGAQIKFETVQLTKSGRPSDLENEGMKALTWAIKKVRGVDPRPIGTGGGTCANIFRLAGYNAYVWETVDEMMHSVNEYCKVDNLVADAKVFATVMATLCCGTQFEV